MVTIRTAERGDAWAIRALIYTTGINPLGLDWRRFIVAVDDAGQVIGCAQVKPHADGSREVASLAVQPGRQRQGIGRALLERLLAEHAPPLYLTCRASLRPFYERFGFRALARAEMPPYFRAIHRLYGFFKMISRRAEGLLVMRRG
jgi:N-acetylglutamate synthase-like GNAT family acetyltransferase